MFNAFILSLFLSAPQGAYTGNWKLTLNGNALAQPSVTSDTAAMPLILSSGDSWPQATGANQAAASIFMSPGIGSKRVQIDDYNNCAGDAFTVTVVTVGADGKSITSTSTVCTEGGAGCAWTAATSNEVTATSLASGMSGIAGITVSANGAYVDIIPDLATLGVSVVTETDATCTTLTSGNPGQNLYGSGNAAAPSIGFYVDPDTGLFYDYTPGLAFDVAGSSVAVAFAGEFKISSGAKLTAAGTSFGMTLLTGADTACTTTCTTGCLFGEDDATHNIVACTDATADRCLCGK